MVLRSLSTLVPAGIESAIGSVLELSVISLPLYRPGCSTNSAGHGHKPHTLNRKSAASPPRCAWCTRRICAAATLLGLCTSGGRLWRFGVGLLAGIGRGGGGGRRDSGGRSAAPDLGAVLARDDHLQPGKRSLEEAGLVADLVVELIQRHGVPASDIAVVAPFRSQVRAIRSALQRTPGDLTAELIVDTVERMQGQEREVVLVSLAVGDPDSLNARAAFFFSVNRLNVAMSRARTKVVVVASSGAFAALPDDPIYLKAANSFRKLQRSLPQIDMTPVYASASRG